MIEQINIPQLTETIFDCSSRGNTTSLNEILLPPTKTVENLRYEAIQQNNLLQVRNDQTRTCLDLAAMLGHSETMKLLAERSSTMMTDAINLTNGMGKKTCRRKTFVDVFSFLLFLRGYSSLHLACVWNQIECVKHIIATGGDIELETVHGEKPVDIARRYHHDQLVDYLQWIGKDLLSLVLI